MPSNYEAFLMQQSQAILSHGGHSLGRKRNRSYTPCAGNGKVGSLRMSNYSRISIVDGPGLFKCEKQGSLAAI